MSFLQCYTLRVSTLSPVNMGCDETYEPTNYVIDGDALYEFNPQEALEALSDPERKNLLRIVDGRPNEELIKKVQAFFYQQRENLVETAGHSFPVGPGVSKLYEARIGKTAQREERGRQVINKLEIERTAYNPMDRLPIFPGSGIKGAIRTALLDSVNEGRRTERGERNRDLQQRLFEYDMRDLHKDPMRLVQVGDARWTDETGLPGSEIRFAVNRKRHPVEKNGRLVQSQAEQKGLYQILECVPAFYRRALSTTLTLQKPNAAEPSPGKLPSKELRWDVSDIAVACNRFYRDLFIKESSLLEKRGYVTPGWAESVRKALPGKDDDHAFLLRIGRHSGAEAVTLNGVRSIRIMQGPGKQAKWESAPKTVWLAASSQGSEAGMLPFGWVLVEIDPQHESPISEAEEVVQLREWAESQRSRKAGYEKQRAERARAAEEAARQRREEEQREKERLEQLARLPPVEREIEEFLEGFAGDNPAAELYNRLKSGTWESEEDRRIVARRIKSLWESEKKWIPDFSGSNKKKKQQQKRCLEVREFLDES
ncbi:MAG: RAMP superfamily CRISPR-associated protein [Pseudomonadota bacterium]|nr:RAMP superfamily CRISPR-associated protein [Pseudomonadota bacterium]